MYFYIFIIMTARKARPTIILKSASKGEFKN